MRSSYKKSDVIFLLKDITGLVQPQSTEEREKEIQAGRHYCEMLPIEYVPTPKYMETYREALKHFAKPTARAVGALADKIIREKGEHVVLVSLARAGTPIGILLKRYFIRKYHLEVPHYSISIIRGKGIDRNAMKFLLGKHRPEELLFVDGWVGKGAILGELKKEISAYPGVAAELAVLADPANMTELCGTHEDILIPSSCLNCTVSGLVSRTFLRGDIIGQDDFHGAAYYGELAGADLSYGFIEAIEKEFEFQAAPKELMPQGFGIHMGKERVCGPSSSGKAGIRDGIYVDHGEKATNSFGIDEVKEIAVEFGISDINLVKTGNVDTTRVLLRRIPGKVLIRQDCRNDKSLAHILRLAEEKNIPVAYYPLQHYKSCGIIKKLADT